jgi:cysteinyl-tRNA synthetase
VKDDIQDLVNKRIQARKDKDWPLSDKIRKEIEEKGYTVDDTPFGMFVKKKGEEKELKPLKVEGFGFTKKGS